MRAVCLTELTMVSGPKVAATSHSSSLTPHPSPVSGFTLVELIIVIVITGILAIVAAALIRGPVEGYFAQANRADLVDMAQQALNEMATDIRGALPNSVRVSGSNALELIHVVDGARYRSGPAPRVSGDTHSPQYYYLQFNTADADFNLLGTFTQLGASRPVTLSNDYLVIYNLGISGSGGTCGTSSGGANAYDASCVITPPGTSITVSTSSPSFPNEDHIHLSSGFKFAYPSPDDRIYLVDTPVSYICSGGSLIRYWNYALSSTQPVPPTGATSGLVVDHLSACRFTYTPGTAQRNGLATLELTVTRHGESVTLVEQVHVDNAP